MPARKGPQPVVRCQESGRAWRTAPPRRLATATGPRVPVCAIRAPGRASRPDRPAAETGRRPRRGGRRERRARRRHHARRGLPRRRCGRAGRRPVPGPHCRARGRGWPDRAGIGPGQRSVRDGDRHPRSACPYVARVPADARVASGPDGAGARRDPVFTDGSAGRRFPIRLSAGRGAGGRPRRPLRVTDPDRPPPCLSRDTGTARRASVRQAAPSPMTRRTGIERAPG